MGLSALHQEDAITTAGFPRSSKFKMKTLLAFALLLATANALSLDALRQMLREELNEREEQTHVKRAISLKDYLAGLEEPHPLARSARSSVLCDASACPATPHLNVDDECAGAWKPNYEARGADGCECLTEYKCCTGRCQELNLNACPKGTEFPTIITDCCDCEVIKCDDCPAPADVESTCPRGHGARPPQCYTYTRDNHYSNDTNAAKGTSTNCWLSGCVENPSDAPADKVCDSRCQNDVNNLSECQFPSTLARERAQNPIARDLRSRRPSTSSIPNPSSATMNPLRLTTKVAAITMMPARTNVPSAKNGITRRSLAPQTMRRRLWRIATNSA